MESVPAGTRTPLLLALDSSTRYASLAVYDGERVLSETTWEAGREHSTQLLDEVHRTLERLGRTIGDVTGLAVACGPGSFTGVRVALSVAKGIAAGLGIPIWTVSTLDVQAQAAGPTGDTVWAVLDAGRNRFAVAAYRSGQRVDRAHNVTSDELLAAVEGPSLVVGEVSAQVRTELERRPGVRVLRPAQSLRRAAYLAELGWAAARGGDPGDPSTAEAIYLGR